MTVFLSKQSTEQCPLTGDPLINLANSGKLVSASCGHKFSRQAMTNWMAFSDKCPVEECGKDIGTLTPVMIATDNVVKNLISNQSTEQCLITSKPLVNLAKEGKLVAIDWAMFTFKENFRSPT